MTVPVRTSTACCAVAAALIMGLSLPSAAVGKPKGERFVPVGELPDGLAVVYFFRSVHSQGLRSVSANGRLVGVWTERHTYFPLLVPPGELLLDFQGDGFWNGMGGGKVANLTLDVEPGRQYYLMEYGRLNPGNVKIADANAVRKRLPKTHFSMRPAFLGFLHYYQADVFADLAVSQDEAGKREAAETALRRAAEHYDSAASAFGLVRTEKFGLIMEFFYPSGMESLRKSYSGLVNRMEELSDMVNAAHACYAGEDQPSLEQCFLGRIHRLQSPPMWFPVARAPLESAVTQPESRASDRR